MMQLQAIMILKLSFGYNWGHNQIEENIFN